MKSHSKCSGFVLLICILFFSLCGCWEKKSTSRPDLKRFEAPLYIHIKPDVKEGTEGHKAFLKRTPERVTFVLENRSDDFLVLRKFEIKDQLPDIERWVGPLYGSVEYSREKDVFFYNFVEQCLSEPVFSMGLIKPNGKIEISRNVVFKHNKIDFQIYFQRLILEDAKKSLYFNFPDEPELGPRKIFRSIDDLEGLLNSNRTDSADWSRVIFKGQKEIPFLRQGTDCTVTLKEPELSLEKVLDKGNMRVFDYIFWKTKKSWVLKGENAVQLAGKDRMIQLGDIDLTVFTLIELSKDKVKCILPLKGYEGFNSKKPKIEGPGYFNPGITLIPKDKISELLQYAERHGDRIKTLVYDPHGLGKRFYIAVGEFNEEERRAFAAGQAK
ncbi:hypothetical protein ACFL2O_08540 [Thermodesulfobacteriota bacterium]